MASPEHCKMTGWAKLWTVPVCKLKYWCTTSHSRQLYPDTSDRKRKCWMWLGTVCMQDTTGDITFPCPCRLWHDAFCNLLTTFFLGWELHIGPQMLWSFICCNNSAFWKYAVHFASSFIAIPSIQEPIQTGQGGTFQHIWWVFLHHWSSEKQRQPEVRNPSFFSLPHLLRECSNTAGWSQHSCTVLMQTKNWTQLHYPHFFLYCKLKVTELVHTGSCTSAACVHHKWCIMYWSYSPESLQNKAEMSHLAPGVIASTSPFIGSRGSWWSRPVILGRHGPVLGLGRGGWSSWGSTERLHWNGADGDRLARPVADLGNSNITSPWLLHWGSLLLLHDGTLLSFLLFFLNLQWEYTFNAFCNLITASAKLTSWLTCWLTLGKFCHSENQLPWNKV